MAILTKLKLVVKTGFGPGAGTDARIYIVFCTRSRSHTYLLPTRRKEMETGQTDTYELALPEGPNLEDVDQVILVNGMDGPNPDWRLLWLKLFAVDADGRSWQLVDDMSERWLDTTDTRAPVYVLPLKRPPESLGDQDVVGPATAPLTLIA